MTPGYRRDVLWAYRKASKMMRSGVADEAAVMFLRQCAPWHKWPRLAARAYAVLDEHGIDVIDHDTVQSDTYGGRDD